jgi:translation initiation factor IF-2
MPKKIFELAKELDMGAIELVETLKSKGFSVRNHMTSLSDEEVDQVVKELKPAPEASSKKTKKKKTVKKKTAKKKVAKKSAEKTAGPKVEEEKTVEAKTESEGEEANKSPKVVTKKKKAVIRRKADSEGQVEKVKDSDSSTLLTAALGDEVGLEEKQEAEETQKEESSFGLRVVSKPEAPKTEQEAVPEKASADSEKKEGSEVFQEKQHRFTPVYIPKAGEVEAEKKSDSTENDDDKKKKEEEGASKKRLGGLASMMSGKKAGASKSAILNQTKADQELKSYAALSGSGRPLYTQVQRKRTYSGPTKDTEITEVKEAKRIVKLQGGSDAETLAKELKTKLKELIDRCLDINLLIKSGDYIGIQLANEIAALYDYRVENVAFDEAEVLADNESEARKDERPLRDPIITIMGHVDHGKTTLLDTIRNAKVATGEAGGITQHIGAYSVKVKNQTLTFLDTPGHAAFAAMRQRGADITDVVVLVVAADDGVMPQTKESVRFCQNAGVPLIVAVNKMDKEGANPDRIKQELTEFEITPEEWGGETQFVNISALKGEGLDELLENIALQAEILELRADPKGKAKGIVIESKIEGGRGPVATILVQSGTLKKGDGLVVGETYGRARSLVDHLGKELKSAGPSVPVQVLGLADPPAPGDEVHTVKNEREAKKIIASRVDKRKALENIDASKQTVTLEDFFAAAADEGVEKRTLNLIIRTDVQGSFEAIKQALEPLSTNEAEVKVLGGGAGPISESDVQLASSAKGFIFGFNMRPISSARRLAEELGVEIKTYSIIYELINDVQLALEGLLDPEFKEEFIGRAEVKETFSVPKIGVIAGSIVTDGKIQVGCQVRLLREGKILFDGKMSSLKRFKDDVKEVKNGFECGVGLEGFNDIKVGDIFEAYLMIEKKRKLEDVRAKEEADRVQALKMKDAAAEASQEESSLN